MDSHFEELFNVSPIVNAALAHDQLAGRNARCKSLSDRQIGGEGLEVAIVDHDNSHIGNPFQYGIQLTLMMRFNQDVQGQFACQCMKVDKLSALERCHNQEHRICAIRTCLVKLDVIDHEFLIESRQGNRLFDVAKIIQTPLKEILVGQHGKSRSARL